MGNDQKVKLEGAIFAVEQSVSSGGVPTWQSDLFMVHSIDHSHTHFFTTSCAGLY